MEGINRLHGIKVCTEFNQKAAPHPIVPEPLKLEVVSGLANSSAHLLHITTLWTLASVSLMTSSTLATSNGFDLKAEQYMMFSPIKYIMRLLFSKIIDNIPDFNENTT